MSGLKLNFKDDSASTSSVGGKPVYSVKRKRQLSTSSEEEAEEEVEDKKEEEEEDQPTSDEYEKTTKVVKQDIKKKTTKKARQVDQSSRPPIYEDYLPDTAQVNLRVEKLVQSYLAKHLPKQSEEEEDEKEEQVKKPPKSKKSTVKSASNKKTVDQKVLLQLSKSFEVLQKKLNKVLE